MKWIKTVSRELPFHSWENWRYGYFGGWKKLLGFSFRNVIFYSERNYVTVYGVEKERIEFLAKLKLLCLKNPRLIIRYYERLDGLDKKAISLSKKRINTKKQLREHIKEILSFMKEYHTIYLIKVYSNRVMTEEVSRKYPGLARRAERLLMHAKWFELSKAVIGNTCRILKLPIGVASSLSYKEILDCIKTGEADCSLAKKRYKKCVYNLATDTYYYGSKADKYIKSLKVVEERVEKISIIKGTVANKGKANGPVIIALGSGDFPKIKKGCILVAHMTTPWYVPHISKVKAIITDEGGIGCHASVMSREFNIPCITGTKFATKVLKDGDIIEVDANKGIIRKL